MATSPLSFFPDALGLAERLTRAYERSVEARAQQAQAQARLAEALDYYAGAAIPVLQRTTGFLMRMEPLLRAGLVKAGLDLDTLEAPASPPGLDLAGVEAAESFLGDLLGSTRTPAALAGRLRDLFRAWPDAPALECSFCADTCAVYLRTEEGEVAELRRLHLIPVGAEVADAGHAMAWCLVRPPTGGETTGDASRAAHHLALALHGKLCPDWWQVAPTEPLAPTTDPGEEDPKA